MTRRKGEVAQSDLKRKWPHRVALPPKRRGLKNSEVICCAAGVLSATPFTYSISYDDSGVAVFCFAKPEDAEALPSASAGSYSELGR
jgi:hypothetical protein